tara:strand:- start:3187 stop:3327 length:141 start_codon:yes stop_codon:yes gene_type:complete
LGNEISDRIDAVANLAIERIIDKGGDDIFKPPIFSPSLDTTKVPTE